MRNDEDDFNVKLKDSIINLIKNDVVSDVQIKSSDVIGGEIKNDDVIDGKMRNGDVKSTISECKELTADEETVKFIEFDVKGDQAETFIEFEVEEHRDVDGDGQTDGGYVHRLLHTMCVCGSMFALGWRNGLVGPTFPDLRLIMNEDLSTASWIFSAISIGGLLGSVSGGLAYDRMSRLFVFLFITGGLGLVAAVTPWCSNFAAMFIAHVLHGAFASALDTAATTDVTVIWRNKAGSYMQAVHGVFSVGAILSPFATQPFLAQRLPVNVTGPMTSFDVRMMSEVQKTSFIDDKGTNYSVFGGTTMNSTPNLNDSSFKASSAEEDDVLKELYGETRIYVTYFASTALCMVVASCYIIVTLVYGNIYKRPVNRNDGLMKIKDREYFLSKRLKNIFTVMLAITLALYVMSERSVTNFLMTFLITKLHWSKAQGSYASSTFWITFAAGRLSGIFVVRYLKTTSVILIYLTSLTCAGASFWIAVVYGVDVLTWISIAVIGYGMSGIFASMFSWLSENVRRLTGKIASILFIFLSIGASLYPIIVGYLMDHVSIMWFVYLQVMIFITITICFIFIATFYNVLTKRYFKTDAIEV